MQLTLRKIKRKIGKKKKKRSNRTHKNKQFRRAMGRKKRRMEGTTDNPKEDVHAC